MVARPTTNQALVEELSRVLGAVSEVIRPLGIVASADGDRNRVGFSALMLNWSVYPRLVVYRPVEGQSLRGGPGVAVERLETCAIDVRHWVAGTETTARRLFLANNHSRMYVTATIPTRDDFGIFQVEGGDEFSVFSFDHPEVEASVAYASVFDGAMLSLPTLLRFLPRVRTNMAPNRFLYYLETP